MNKPGRFRAVVLLALLLVLSAALTDRQLPSLEGRSVTHAMTDVSDTPLARAVAPLAAAHTARTGVYPLTAGRAAFAARVLLCDAARRSLDIQYYIWHDDLSGTLLFDAVRRAAARGVRVRVLVDDNGVAGLDPILAALDALPNLELRIYNPFLHRRFRAVGYLTDFRRLNRRMHNKSLTADNTASIIGGRNVGDEYFGADPHVNFADLDVLAVGRVVGEVSSIFDRYWNSASAYPLTSIVQLEPANAEAVLRARLAELGGETAVREYVRAVESSTVVRDALAGTLPFEWVETRVLADDPAKTLERKSSGSDPRLLPRLAAAVGEPETRFDVVSPYFVPMAEGTTAFSDLARRGVRVRVLTNSLAATDVAAVHAGYAKRRRDLLRAGVQLFELEPTATPQAAFDDWVHALGGSAASLHAKTFAVDGQRAFVGSFNFDPRSAELNTEMGFVIHSPTIAEAIHAGFDTTVPHIAYEPRLNAQGDLEWIARDRGVERIYITEPNTGQLQRTFVRVLSWLPIDWML